MKSDAEEFRLGAIRIMGRAALSVRILEEKTGDVDSPENREALCSILACVLEEFAKLITPDQMMDTFGTPGSRLS